MLAAADAAADEARRELVRSQGLRLLRTAGSLALQAVRLPESTTRVVAAFMPLTRLMAQPAHRAWPSSAASWTASSPRCTSTR